MIGFDLQLLGFFNGEQLALVWFDAVYTRDQRDALIIGFALVSTVVMIGAVILDSFRKGGDSDA
jgi:hypothetical protein